MCSVERSELWNAHCCAFCASVNGADSAVRFASLRFGSLRFASVCSVNGVLVAPARLQCLTVRHATRSVVHQFGSALDIRLTRIQGAGPIHLPPSMGQGCPQRGEVDWC